MGDGPVVGIFVGGRSRRMGGEPKGLLHVPGGDETLVESLARAASEAGLEAVLVGDVAAYDEVLPGLLRLSDRPTGIGPLGGLGALLHHAGDGLALSVACDMPHVDAGVLRVLVDHPAEAAVLAPRRDGRWEPMLARWRAAAVRPTLGRAVERGVRSFQALLGEIEVAELAVDARMDRALVDWDNPADVERAR